MKRNTSRWFPLQGGATLRLEYGWRLTHGDVWDAENFEDEVMLMSLHLSRDLSLEMEFRAGPGDVYRIDFAEVSELQFDGTFYADPSEIGWPVLGSPMIVTDRVRDDGRFVYMLEIPDFLVCFASRPGVLLENNPTS